MGSSALELLSSFLKINIVLIFAFLFLVVGINNKFNNKFLKIISAFIIFAVSTVLIYYNYIGSTFMYYFSLSFTMVSVVFILNFVKLNLLDYTVLFSIIILHDRFIGMFSSYFGKTFFICTLFFTILCIYKIRIKMLKGNIFNMWLTFFLTVIDGIIFGLIFDFVIRKIGYSFDSAIAKTIVWSFSLAAIIAINLVLIYLVKKYFNKYFYEINEMGKKYPSIEKYFIYITIGIMILIMLIHYGYYNVFGYNYQNSMLLTIFCMIGLVIQLLYLTLLFRVTYFKDNLYDKELENQSLALYSSNLEKNIDDIRAIKHDIKNIFFTMGQYVEESNNEEMKLFYKTKIYPFASDEILKNDLYSKLTSINNEQLKAFLYYKISQALERNINTELDIDIKREIFAVGIDFADLIRILGILIDNGIEECVSNADSKISIKISQNNELASYVIKNTVASAKKEKGIKAGVSTKGENRGNGLIIVQNAIEKYDFVMLNSYFTEDFFVQNLNIYYDVGVKRYFDP